MKKVELLSPAGNMECLIMAVQNGCDAVYVSGKKFGARKFAENFTIDELKEAIKYCHIYNVKLYVTVNTIIYENELEEVLTYIKELYENGVDAFIMQDLGLIKKAKERYPDIIIHASTQAHNHNDEGLTLLKELGVERAVLARELSLTEINNLKTPIEKEVFIHGALCVSYSGECLFSSMLLGRSGNRGECAGICRLPFTLIKDGNPQITKGNYLLSPKELCNIENLDSILDANIDSLKIEGRMKSKEYVGYITRMYRKQIDAYYKKKKESVSKEEKDQLKILYNRGFTKGFLNNERNETWINQQSPNHQGLPIGKIIEIKDQLKIKLDAPIHQYDGIRYPNDEGEIINYLYDEKKNLISEAKKGDIVYLDNKTNLKECGIIRKTTDYLLKKELEKLPLKKVKIKMIYQAKLQKPFYLKVIDQTFQIEKFGPIVTKAQKIPVSKQLLEEKLKAVGNTPFEVEEIKGTIAENSFLPMSAVKEFRRNILEELINLKTKKTPKQTKNISETIQTMKKTYEISVLVRTEEQIEALKKEKVILYTENSKWYQKYKNECSIYYRTSRVVSHVPDFAKEKLLVCDIGSVDKLGKTNEIISDSYLNVVNHETIRLLKEKNVKKIGLSWELSKKDLIHLMNTPEAKASNLELPIYGRVELMVMKHCIINTNRSNKEKSCSLCKQNIYEIEDRNHKRYPLYAMGCLTYILNSKPIDRTADVSEYKKLGITNFRLDLWHESKEETQLLIKRIQQNLQNSTKC